MRKVFSIAGMHCHSCEMRIEAAMRGAGASYAKADFSNGTAEAEWDESTVGEEALAAAITGEGYETVGAAQAAEQAAPADDASETRREVTEDAGESGQGDDVEEAGKPGAQDAGKEGGTLFYYYALLFALALVFAYMVASNLQISLPALPEISLPSPGSPVALATIFTAGLLTGLHCVGMCGAFCAASANTRKGLALYLGAKTASYTAIGVALGALGGVLVISNDVRSGLALLAGAFMILYALSVFGVKFAARVMAKLPRPSAGGGSKGPVMAGLLNGFMPCGPLQAMQIYALSTGSAFTGGLVMLAFGLGTIPFMAGFGFIVNSLTRTMRDTAFRVGAVAVLLLGLLMLGNGLAAFVPNAAASPIALNSTVAGSVTVRTSVYGYGYDPAVVEVPSGVPVRLVFDVKELTGCNSVIRIPSLGVNIQLRKGENSVDLPALKEGTYDFSCGMGMLRGKIVAGAKGVDEAKAALAAAPSGACSMSGGGCSCGG